MRIFHIVARALWDEAVRAGEYRPPSLEREGFVHFSFAGQVAGTANARYRSVPDLVVVEVAADRLDTPVVVEDTYGSGTAYPHVYGPVPAAAADAVHELPRDQQGEFSFSPDRGSGAASRDH